jgi:hypothetical protein
MFSAAWKKDTVLAFINDEALTRGAAIALPGGRICRTHI